MDPFVIYCTACGKLTQDIVFGKSCPHFPRSINSTTEQCISWLFSNILNKIPAWLTAAFVREMFCVHFHMKQRSNFSQIVLSIFSLRFKCKTGKPEELTYPRCCGSSSAIHKLGFPLQSLSSLFSLHRRNGAKSIPFQQMPSHKENSVV